MNPTRPTIRCLRDDLGFAELPPARVALDELDHPLLRKASAHLRFTSEGETVLLSEVPPLILSKAFLLAADTTITDPSITRQIHL
ncbi:hypothetical protein ACIBO2_20065 [Nonomuraea sp. NPDC050022]|uniref:DUF7737 domain-containing protein n=1 Tax=unclassified Nonomuraea TaxID=2593643 RepID=UPI0034114F74